MVLAALAVFVAPLLRAAIGVLPAFGDGYAAALLFNAEFVVKAGVRSHGMQTNPVMAPLLRGAASFLSVAPAAVIAFNIRPAGTADIPLLVANGEYSPDGITTRADSRIAMVFLAVQIGVLPGAAPFLAGAPQPVIAVRIEHALVGAVPVHLVTRRLARRFSRHTQPVLTGLRPIAPQPVRTRIPVTVVQTKND
jgi:hypothetical protein